MEDHFFHGLGTGDGFQMIQVHYVYCAPYFYYYSIHSTSNNQVSDPRGWGLLVYIDKDNENAPIKLIAIWPRNNTVLKTESSQLPQGKTFYQKYTTVQDIRVICDFKCAMLNPVLIIRLMFQVLMFSFTFFFLQNCPSNGDESCMQAADSNLSQHS